MLLVRPATSVESRVTSSETAHRTSMARPTSPWWTQPSSRLRQSLLPQLRRPPSRRMRAELLDVLEPCIGLAFCFASRQPFSSSGPAETDLSCPRQLCGLRPPGFLYSTIRIPASMFTMKYAPSDLNDDDQPMASRSDVAWPSPEQKFCFLVQRLPLAVSTLSAAASETGHLELESCLPKLNAE